MNAKELALLVVKRLNNSDTLDSTVELDRLQDLNDTKDSVIAEVLKEKGIPDEEGELADQVAELITAVPEHYEIEEG